MKNVLLKLFLVSIITIISANTVQAQNYWGDDHVQDLDKNPNSGTLSPSGKNITELPDIPSDNKSKPDLKPKINLKNDEKQVVSSSKSPVIELGAKSEKIPVGTKLDIVLNTNLNAKKTKKGEPFSATVNTDIIVNNDVVLPAGSLIRGRIGKVKKPGLFSKSGSMLLNFDHIVTPLGKQITLDVDLSKTNTINKKGELVANQGLGEAIKDSAKSGYNTAKTVTKAGYDLGMSAGKVPVVATAPVGFALGSVAGTTVFATKSAIAIFKKGGNPIINSGDRLEINFTDDLDVSVN